MNSGCLLELPAAPPQTADLPAPEISRHDRAAVEPFGALLDQVASETEAEEVDRPSLDEAEGDEKESAEDQMAACAFGLISFCPPPELIEEPPPNLEAIELNVAPEELPARASDLELSLAGAPMLAEALAEVVRPQEGKAKRSDQTEKSEGIALDPKLFEPVEEGAVEMETARGGTVVAKQEMPMKNVEKAAEVAVPIEQKMPMRDFSRRSIPEAVRVDSIAFLGQTDFTPSIDFQIGHTPEVAPVKSLDTTHLLEGIRTEVSKLRQLGDAAMSVVLRPATGGAVTVNLTIARDGTVNAQARCERPEDFKNLSVQWSQLQQSLGAQGIRLADLGNTGQSQQHGGQQGASQNFNREQNQQPPRRESDAPSFEDELAGTNPRFGAAKTFQPAGAGSTRRWQSWA